MKEYIDQVTNLPNPPAIDMEMISHKDAKNCYHARYSLQRHYQDETYQLQLDSHHRVVKNWDVKLIKMLHNTDAGEFAVITVYSRPYSIKDPMGDGEEVWL